MFKYFICIANMHKFQHTKYVVVLVGVEVGFGVLKSIKFDHFNIFRTENNQFRSDELNSGFNLIQSPFDHNVSRFGDLD